jgi:hypothetical protein
MLGLIFNEFLDFAESQRPGRGRSLLGIVGRQTALRYEPTECYEYEELVMLAGIVARGETVGTGDVLRRFGVRLFERLITLYPVLRGRGQDALGFLRGLDDLHREVAALHAVAELPSTRCRELAPGVLEVEYTSVRNLADLAEGLIHGCIAHFGGGVELSRHDLPGAPGRAARFVLTKAAAAEPARRAG